MATAALSGARLKKVLAALEENWQAEMRGFHTYNTLADFYADANNLLANPNRTVDPITLRRFQVRYSNIPGQTQPIQPLDVWYSGGYLQDEWHAKSNLTVTAGLRGLRQPERGRPDLPG